MRIVYAALAALLIFGCFAMFAKLVMGTAQLEHKWALLLMSVALVAVTYISGGDEK